jgi:DNA-binding PadR family transcriptional regulator
MSSIRLYVLSSLAERGAMHGHGLRLLAEEEHIDSWTDFTVGAVYGVLKRMVADGLIEVVRTEREGNYPERQVYDITAAGEAALAQLREEGLAMIDLRPDSFDLAISALDPERLDRLDGIIHARLDALTVLVTEKSGHLAQIDTYLWAAEKWSFGHGIAKLRAEIAWHHELLAALPEIIADEGARRNAKGIKK